MKTISIKASQKDSQSQLQRLSQIPPLPENGSAHAEEADNVEEGPEIVQLDPPVSPQVSDAEDTEFEWPASPVPSQPRRSESTTPARTATPEVCSGKRKKRDVKTLLQDTLEERYQLQEEVILKKHKMEMDIKKEEIASQERIAEAKIAAKERMSDRQVQQAERLAQIQADAQVKQTESFQQIMDRLLGILGPRDRQ